MNVIIRIIVSIVMTIQIIILPQTSAILNIGFITSSVFALIIIMLFFLRIYRKIEPKRKLLSLAILVSFICIVLLFISNKLLFNYEFDSRFILSLLIYLIWILFAIDQNNLIKDKKTKFLCMIAFIATIFNACTLVQFLFGLFLPVLFLVNRYLIISINEELYISLFEVIFAASMIILITCCNKEKNANNLSEEMPSPML